MKPSKQALVAFIVAASLMPAQADEGMWTFNDFPADKVAKAYGFRPDQEWLDHVRLASVRLAGGCSAGFVSPHGLVQTNHHCARDCIEQLSTADKEYRRQRLLRARGEGRAQVPDVEVNQLVDITRRDQPHPQGHRRQRTGRPSPRRSKPSRRRSRHECSRQDDAIRCDIVELYHGGRLRPLQVPPIPGRAARVRAGGRQSPFSAAIPTISNSRVTTSTVSYLRVYADNKPLDSPRQLFALRRADARPGDLAFISGHPGSTSSPRDGRPARIPA